MTNKPPLVPELYVSSIRSSLAFYRGVIGFELAYERPEERFACIRLAGAYLMLEEVSSFSPASPAEFEAGRWATAQMEHPFGRGINFEIRVPSARAIERRLKAAGFRLLLDVYERTYRVVDHPYRVLQCLVADPDGYLLRFSEPLDSEPFDSEPLER